MPTTKTLSRLAIAGMTAAFVLSVPAPSGATPPTFCSEAGSNTVISWTGDSTSSPTSWTDSSNWSPEMVPDAAGTGTYATQYVCIGEGHGGKPATVNLTGAHYVAGIDLDDDAQLTVSPTSNLYLGADGPPNVVPSYVRGGSELTVNGGTLGGNGGLTVNGTLNWTGHLTGRTGHTGVQTGSGKTVIGTHGTVLVDGTGFGRAELAASRVLDNHGTIRFANNGYIAMDDGTSLIDEAHSVLDLDGNGGIYRGATVSGQKEAVVTQDGAIVESGPTKSIVGVPVKFGSSVSVAVKKGSLLLQASSLPTATLARDAGYGIGTCQQLKNAICRDIEATPSAPQVAMVTTSTEAPKTSKIKVRFATTNPTKVGGHALIGREFKVSAPTERTTHSTHLTLSYDATLKGVKHGLKPNVYRNGHKITYCASHGLTALNPSCVASLTMPGSGPTPTHGDLDLFVITIKPDATWAVAT